MTKHQRTQKRELKRSQKARRKAAVYFLGHHKLAPRIKGVRAELSLPQPQPRPRPTLECEVPSAPVTPLDPTLAFWYQPTPVWQFNEEQLRQHQDNSSNLRKLLDVAHFIGGDKAMRHLEMLTFTYRKPTAKDRRRAKAQRRSWRNMGSTSTMFMVLGGMLPLAGLLFGAYGVRSYDRPRTFSERAAP